MFESGCGFPLAESREILARLGAGCSIPPQMPDGALAGWKRPRWLCWLGATLMLGLVLMASPGKAEPLARGQIMARARVLAPVGQQEVLAYLARWESDQRVQRSARARLAQGPSKLEAVEIDHDRLRIRLLHDEGEPCLQIESLAN